MILARSRRREREEEGDSPGVRGGVLEAAEILKTSLSGSIDPEESAGAKGGKRYDKECPTSDDSTSSPESSSWVAGSERVRVKVGALDHSSANSGCERVFVLCSTSSSDSALAAPRREPDPPAFDPSAVVPFSSMHDFMRRFSH